MDERGLIIALRGMKLIIPRQLQFVAERLLNSNLRPGTSDNDANAMRNMGMLPQGYVINDYLTDTDAFFIKTDAPNGLKHFERMPMATAMDPDFDTGNMRYKAERDTLSASQILVPYSVHQVHKKFKYFFRAIVCSRPFFMYNENNLDEELTSTFAKTRRMTWLTQLFRVQSDLRVDSM